MTPQESTRRQLQWMKTHLPVIPAETERLKAKRLKALKGILSRIVVDAEGHMRYGNTADQPDFAWPAFNPKAMTNKDRREDATRGAPRKCRWPGGCERPPRPRTATRGKWPIYCGEDGHETHNAAKMFEAERHAERRWPRVSKGVNRILLELYFDGEIPSRLYPSCGVPTCVHPGHQGNRNYDPGTRAKLRAKTQLRIYSTAEIRDMVTMRGEGYRVSEVTKKYGVTVAYICALTSGLQRPDETADLRRKYTFRDGRKTLTPDEARAVVQLKLDFPELTQLRIADKLGLKEKTVWNILHGQSYATDTEDLRGLLDG